jgi:hypothetical protein
VTIPAVTIPRTCVAGHCYPAVHYPAQHYPAQHYPAQHYPAVNIPAQTIPASHVPRACVHTSAAFAPAHTTIRVLGGRAAVEEVGFLHGTRENRLAATTVCDRDPVDRPHVLRSCTKPGKLGPDESDQVVRFLFFPHMSALPEASCVKSSLSARLGSVLCLRTR